MSGVTKNTIQKILLIALSAMTVAMVLISVFNYKDNKQKSEYLDKENVFVQEELIEIIKSYDHLTAHDKIDYEEVIAERTKAEELLKKIRQTVLDYETIINYRKELLVLRKNNQRLQHNFDDDSISSNRLNTLYK